MDSPAFTDRMKRVLAFASESADGLGHGYITSQHLLYALICESKGLAAAVIASFGILPGQIQEFLQSTSALHDRTPMADLSFSDEIRGLFSSAVAAAMEWGDEEVDTEHILFAMLEINSSADEIFEVVRINKSEVIDRIEAIRATTFNSSAPDNALHAFRFTLESAQVLSIALDLSRRSESQTVSTSHLLAALSLLPGKVQSLLVDRFGMEPQTIVSHLESPITMESSKNNIPLDALAQMVLGYAVGEVWARGHLVVTPLHIALGIARCSDSDALNLLADLGITKADFHEALSDALPPSVRR